MIDEMEMNNTDEIKFNRNAQESLSMLVNCKMPAMIQKIEKIKTTLSLLFNGKLKIQ